MQIYTYTSEEDKHEIDITFSATIHAVVKMKFNKVLDKELAVNPYSRELLSTVVHEFHKKACKDLEKEAKYDQKQIAENFEVDELLHIYTTIMLERSVRLSGGMKKAK